MTSVARERAHELGDALDRTDLSWFGRNPHARERRRKVRPAEATKILQVYGVRPARVVVRQVTPGALVRCYDTGATVVALVGNVWGGDAR